MFKFYLMLSLVLASGLAEASTYVVPTTDHDQTFEGLRLCIATDRGPQDGDIVQMPPKSALFWQSTGDAFTTRTIAAESHWQLGLITNDRANSVSVRFDVENNEIRGEYQIIKRTVEPIYSDPSTYRLVNRDTLHTYYEKPWVSPGFNNERVRHNFAQDVFNAACAVHPFPPVLFLRPGRVPTPEGRPPREEILRALQAFEASYGGTQGLLDLSFTLRDRCDLRADLVSRFLKSAGFTPFQLRIYYLYPNFNLIPPYDGSGKHRYKFHVATGIIDSDGNILIVDPWFARTLLCSLKEWLDQVAADEPIGIEVVGENSTGGCC